MSGFIVVAFAGALLQQAAPHPSTLEPYRAPAIRPFEPTSDFGRERAQGDEETEAHRRPLDAPVSVDAYARSYEYSPGDVDVAYDQGVASAEIRVDQSAGPLDGRWQVSDEHGRPLFALAMTDPGRRSMGDAVEGGWRGRDGAGAATAEGHVLTLEGLGVLSLQPATGGWRGTLTAGGHARPVSLSRPG
ncbi:MAG: hypothetical protein ACK4UQ_05025 [Brevundimonas sp.]